MLALALLGSAAQRDPSVQWLFSAANLLSNLAGRKRPVIRFEHCLAPSDLGEVPRVTSMDVTISTQRAFIAVETKWSEAGLGGCSCAREGEGDPRIGFDCADRVYSRKIYWKTAADFLELEEARLSFEPCSLSVAYQVVRSIAAAWQLSRGRIAGFILIYDNTNPYFRSTNGWPGWPAILTQILNKQLRARFLFRAISWQDLIGKLPLPADVRLWAAEKHRLF